MPVIELKPVGDFAFGRRVVAAEKQILVAGHGGMD